MNEQATQTIGVRGLSEFIMEVNNDEGRRQRLLDAPRTFLQDEGIFISDDVDIQVHMNTDEVFYLVFPPDPNEMLQDEALTAIAGGKCAGTAGTAGSASTASTLTICWGSASSAGSVGSAGSGG